MEKEIWKDIKDYEGLYQVSSYGRVKSLDRVINYNDGRKFYYKGQTLKTIKDRVGYLLTHLCNNGQKKTVKIHRLVAEAFIPNPNNLPEVNHKDENKASNFVFLNKDGSVDFDKSNLEWCSRLYNLTYGTRLKRQVEKRSIPVLQLDTESNEIIAEYPSASEAERQLNIHSSSISHCCRGERKTAGGFKWCYK